MHLSLALLGTFGAALDGRPVSEFHSSKVRGLLAYLAVEAGRPQPRALLACLLWPDWADSAALGNLRFSLAKLRQAICDQDAAPPFLLITRETIQLNPAADWDVDVCALQQGLAASQWQAVDSDGQPAGAVRRAIAYLEAAASRYRGSFLEGFAVGDSAAFEDWTLLRREGFEQDMRSTLHGLAALHARLGDHGAAEGYARRLLAMDPWDELANRRLMAALAENGQRNAALRHYAAYQEELAQELGAEPAGETIALYEQLKRRAVSPASHPAPTVAAAPSGLSPSPLMARESQLAELDGYLTQAVAGQGSVVFVSGEAGSGKSALLAEFARQALSRQGDLLVAGGRCNAFTGVGDPYLPFREAARQLAGDVEAFAAAGLVTDEQARRLQAVSHGASRTLVETAPDLVDRLVPAHVLAHPTSAAQAGNNTARDTRLENLVRQGRAAAGLEQADLFSQFTGFLVTLARTHPLLLMVDDLQWADGGSLSLLFHLGRRVTGARILIAGAYRSEDVAAGQDGGRHPLQAVINELRRVHGSAEIDLNQADGRHFVDAVLDREANHLDSSFRETLFQHTGGHPLFTLELLRGLRERGGLERDAGGAWVATGTLDWSSLPPRVEAVIAERIERLPPDAQELLAAASVEGEEFTAEVAARVLGLERTDVLRQLSDVLGKHHRLVRGSGTVWPEGERLSLSRYRFQHFLFHAYLYGRLDPVQRTNWHGLTAQALMELYGARRPETAVQLAWHFEQAGQLARAVDHLLQAGNQAMRLGAYRQAVEDFNRGLALLAALPASPARAQQELQLRLALTGPLSMLHRMGDPIRSDAAALAMPLSRQAGSGMQAVLALVAEAVACRDRCDYSRAAELGTQILTLAQVSQDRQATLLAHFVLGSTATFSGRLVPARAGLEAALGLYRPDEDRELALALGADIQAMMLTWLGMVLWLLGYPDQALTRMRGGIGLAQKLAEPFTYAAALTSAIWLGLLGRTGPDASTYIADLRRLIEEKQMEAMQPWLSVYDGWLLTRHGRIAAGIEVIRRSLTATGRAVGAPGLLVVLAQTCLEAGMYDQGRAAVHDGLTLVKTGIGQIPEPELYRLLGALTLCQAPSDNSGLAASWFLRAIEAARAQEARAWELRASVDLARLWRQQGKAAEARALLTGVYGWFAEGFDTPDLREAAALLNELAPEGPQVTAR